jgi:uncharacterized protein (TIGR00304 family)
MRTSEGLIKAGTLVTFIGFALILLNVVVSVLQNSENSQMGGLIMIGPIPIAFGSSPEITTNMLGVGLLIMILYLFLWRK